MAQGAGEILLKCFGQSLKVSYKGKGERDPVTEADRASQDFLKEAIRTQFPEHGVVAEEDAGEDDSVAPDYVWILDPLDGTTNFLNGLPIYAVSVGVLYKGEPVVGSLFVPWPHKNGGVVLHARKGGGTYVESEPLTLPETSEPEGKRLTGLPSYFGAWHTFRKQMRGKIGETRTTGSIAYEMALAAQGVLQYAIHTRPRIWDVAGGVALLLEAGGVVMVRSTKSKGWEPLRSFFDHWESGVTTLKQVREWSIGMMISGADGMAEEVAANVRGRRHLGHRLAWGIKRLL